MNFDWIGFTKSFGFCGYNKQEPYQISAIFISDLANVPMKSFNRNIYWDDKRVERMKALDLLKVHPYTPPKIKNVQRRTSR